LKMKQNKIKVPGNIVLDIAFLMQTNIHMKNELQLSMNSCCVCQGVGNINNKGHK
jgi:hypothetical protein